VTARFSQGALALDIGFLLLGMGVLALRMSGRAGNLGLVGAILPVLALTLYALILPFGAAKSREERRRSGSGDAADKAAKDLDFLYVFCFRPFGALLDLEFDPVSLIERTESPFGDCTLVNEYIFAAAFGCDESEPFGIVEPFHSTLHLRFS
jgi:hypothetical protein